MAMLLCRIKKIKGHFCVRQLLLVYICARLAVSIGYVSVSACQCMSLPVNVYICLYLSKVRNGQVFVKAKARAKGPNLTSPMSTPYNHPSPTPHSRH